MSLKPHCVALATLLLLVSAAHASYYVQPTPSNTAVPAVPSTVPSPRYYHRVPRVSYNSVAYRFLAPHNAVRSALGLPPLEWDAGLAGYAATYAEQRRQDCAMVHSGGPYGENIFWGSGSDWTPMDAVRSWIDEARYYDVGTNSCSEGDCGHYTQIVWRQTTRLGCARVVCDNDAGVFVTCNYDPPGNVIAAAPTEKCKDG